VMPSLYRAADYLLERRSTTIRNRSRNRRPFKAPRVLQLGISKFGEKRVALFSIVDGLIRSAA
jgi:hypothetical protein